MTFLFGERGRRRAARDLRARPARRRARLPKRRRGAGPDAQHPRPGGLRPQDRPQGVSALAGKVALVAGATRGAGRGTAVALGEAGATVYCTGRTTRERRSEYDRPETIEETAELVDAAGGTGIAVAVDHLEADQVRGAGRANRRRAGPARRARQRHLGRRAAVRVGHARVGARPRQGAAAPAPRRRHPPDHQPLRAGAADPQPGRARRRDDRRHARLQRRALPRRRPSTTWPRRRRCGSPSPRGRSSLRTAAPPSR